MSGSQVEVDENSLTISFSLGRNKTVYVTGTYEFQQTSVADRLRFWSIVNDFGHELGDELAANYDATLLKIVQCEVEPGSIMFEIETNVSASLRRKAIEAVQTKFEAAVGEAQGPEDNFRASEAPQPFPVNGPETPQ